MLGELCAARLFTVGLGVTDLRFFGSVLCLRWEWLMRVDPERGWERLPPCAERPVAAMLEASLSIVLADGAAARFWTAGADLQ